jgi:uncharacterized protein
METLPVDRRIVGYDLARALAVFGMVVVNFKIVMGAEHNGPAWLVGLVSLLSGRAAATFVILAGIGISLLSRKARISNDGAQLGRDRNTLLRRALFLVVVGLLYTPIWPADILHFYGIYIAVAACLLSASTRRLWIFSGLLISGSVAMILMLDYGHGWNWETLDYSGFWSPAGMIRHLFFNGFHPVIPWLGFLLVGMIVGRQDVGNPAVRRRLFTWGAAVALSAEGLSRLLMTALSRNGNPVDQETVVALLGTGPMPPMPLYMFAGAGTGVVLIVASVSFGLKYGDATWLRPFIATGQLALTLYVGHVLLGMGILESIGKLENQSLVFSLLASAVFCAVSVVFAFYWRRRFKRGPVEAIMRYLTRSPGRTA